MTPSTPELALRWLVRLRWWAVGAQASALAAATWGLGLELPTFALAAVLGTIALSNLVLGRLRRVSPQLLPVLLLADLLGLTVMLALTGGPTNPFTVLYVVQVALAAVVLGPRWTWGTATAAVACFGALFLVVPSEPEHVHDPEAMRRHLIGMWIGFAVTGGALAGVVARLAAELRDREAELTTAREEALRTVRLASLSTLAAGAAHEMGSPLTTIAVVAAELEECADPRSREDLALIRRETDRCRTILARMSTDAGVHPAEPFVFLDMATVLAQVRERLGPQAERVVLGDCPTVSVRAPAAALERALLGLVDNALRAAPAPSEVRLEAAARDGAIVVSVHDNGPGIPLEQLDRVGEPFYTTRPAGEGMGLGVFLARRLAEELGGSFSIHSRPGHTSATFTFTGQLK